MLDELEEMICFAAVCEAGSMTAAAKALHRSKAHISRKVTDLEVRIKTRLLHRTTRKISITDAGLQLRDEALQLYRNSQRLNHRAASLDTSLSGKFVITAPVSIATYLLAPQMPALQESFPDVEFELKPTNENLALIKEGVDLAIRTGSVQDDSLIAHQIGMGRDILFQSIKSHPPVIEMSDLLQRRLLINPYSLTENTLRLYKGEESLELQPAHITKAGEYPLLVELVKEGNDIGLAPDYCIQKLVDEGLIEPLLPDWRGREWPILITYPYLSPLPLKLSKISAFLRQRFAGLLSSGSARSFS